MTTAMTRIQDMALTERPLAAARITKQRVVAGATTDTNLGLAPVIGFIRTDRFVGIAEVLSPYRDAVTGTIMMGATGFACDQLTAVFDTQWQTLTGTGDILVQVHCVAGRHPEFILLPYDVQFDRALVVWGEPHPVAPHQVGMYGDVMTAAFTKPTLARRLPRSILTDIAVFTPDLQFACDVFTSIALQAGTEILYFVDDDAHTDDELQELTVNLIPLMKDVLASWSS